MNEERRYQNVHADVQRLLQQAASDCSPGGIVGFGQALLAAVLFAKNEEAHLESQAGQSGKETKE